MRHQLLAVVSCIAVGCGPEMVGGDVGGTVPLGRDQQEASTSLVYSKLLGVAGERWRGSDVAVDPWGSAYAIGYRGDPSQNLGFFAKYDSSGQLQVLKGVTLGSLSAMLTAVAIGPDGRVYLAGYTSAGGFVGRLNAAGDGFEWSTRSLAGWMMQDVAVDASGWVYGVAQINPTGVTNGEDVIVGTFDGGGQDPLFTRTLAGSSWDYPSAIVVDGSGHVIVSGSTLSANFPTQNAYQSTWSGGQDGFVTKLNAPDLSLVYSTYLGGNEDDGAWDLALDSTGNLYVAGWAAWTGFPVPPGAPACSGGAFISKLDPTGMLSFTKCIYLGGWVNRVVVDRSSDTVYASGFTDTDTLPVTGNPFQGNFRGPTYDGFFLQLSPSGALTYASYLGGQYDDSCSGLALDSSLNIYLTGNTQSIDFPTTGDSYVPYSDLFLTKFSAMPIDFPPTCTITAPAAGAPVSGTIAVNATATDDRGVTRVEFYLGGSQLIGSDSSPPFSVNWNTAAAWPGYQALTCKAYDAAGQVGTSPAVTVTVKDQTLPTCAVSAPATVSGTVNVTATAWDNVGVTRVDFYVDGTLIGSDSTAPYGINWVTTTVSLGGHVLTCKAYDAAGNSGTSPEVTVTVKDQAPPTCAITAPTAGATVSGTVSITATATDDRGVTRVEFYVDGTQLPGSDSTPPYTMDWVTTAVSPGNRKLTCKAYDAALNVGTSTEVTVTVPDKTPPTCAITAPATVSGTVNVTATASDDVGVTRVEFYVDGTLIGSDGTSPYGIDWVTTTASPGSHGLTCKAYDAANNFGTSSEVSVTVAPQTAIAILSPAAWQDVSSTVKISVSIQSNVSVTRVDYTVIPPFLEGGGDEVQFIGTTATSPFGMNWDTTPFPDGFYVLQATAYDVNGHSTTAQVPLSILNYPCGTPWGVGLGSVICLDGASF